MVNKLFCALLCLCCLLLSSCEEEWQEKNNPIAKDDFSTIQIESQICEHSQYTIKCLRSLEARIQ